MSYLLINLLDLSVYINPKLFIPSFFLLIFIIWFLQAVESILYISHWYEFIDYTCKWYLTFVFLSLSSLTWCDYFFNTPTLLTASLFHSVLRLSGVPVIDVLPCLHFSSTGCFGGFHVLPIERVLPWKSRCTCHFERWFSVDLTFLIAHVVKNLPAMQETPVWFLGQEDLLEKAWATHSSILGLPLWLT